MIFLTLPVANCHLAYLQVWQVSSQNLGTIQTVCEFHYVVARSSVLPRSLAQTTAVTLVMFLIPFGLDVLSMLIERRLSQCMFDCLLDFEVDEAEKIEKGKRVCKPRGDEICKSI